MQNDLSPRPTSRLHDAPVPTRLQLSALCVSVMLLYGYCDYFELYAPGKLPAMLAGRMALGAVSQPVLLAMAALMAVPSLLVAACLLLPARAARWLNIGSGIFYSAIMLLAMQGSWPFYQLFSVLEITVTALIVWLAWRWPRVPA